MSTEREQPAVGGVCINCGAAETVPDWTLCQACIDRDYVERESRVRALKENGRLRTVRLAREAATDSENATHERGTRSLERRVRERLYVASKTKHAARWRELRARGWPVVASWIDEAGAGETKDFADLAVRCIREAMTADYVLLYVEPGEVHKGSLVEVGAALAAGVPVRCVGDSRTISKTFRHHPLWSDHPSVEAAALSNIGVKP